jgi:putative hydrolase of the HAD superfamily
LPRISGPGKINPAVEFELNMPMNHRDVTTWLFDLDNTLYPADSGLFDQVRDRIGEYLERYCGVSKADVPTTQRRYRDQFGSTLAGLMADNLTDPEPFLSYVHDVDYGVIDPHPALADALAGLEGRRFIFTNGSTDHAEKALRRLGCADLFDDVFDIARADFVPKPHPAPYDQIVRELELVPPETAFVEDMARNLAPAKSLGMITILVAPTAGPATAEADYVISDLAGWLGARAPATS